MTSIVVLNRNFQFHTEVQINKFWKWLVKGKIHVVVSHDGEQSYVDYANQYIPVDQAVSLFKIRRPVVVRLLEFVGFHPKTEEIGFSKEAIFYRDDNYCQYWHFDEFNNRFKYKCKPDERTLDHIIPKSRGGDVKSFLNCVCACRNCNTNIKRGKTPKEAGLVLICQPYIPKRNKRDFVTFKFAYDPNKLSHRIYMDHILKAEKVE